MLEQQEGIERLLRARNASYQLVDVDEYWERHRDDEREQPASRPQLVYAIPVGNYTHLVCIDEQLFAMTRHHCYEEEN